MKTLKYIFPILFSIFFIACSNDDDDATIIPPNTDDSVEHLMLATTITNDTHEIEVYTEDGKIHQGYTEFTFRLKDIATETYISDVDFSWTPVMQMPSMQHSCPTSSITKVADSKALYTAYAIFQMTGENGMGWTLNFEYTTGGETFDASKEINVKAATKKNVSVFMGSNGTKYILGLIPAKSEIGINDLTLSLHKMTSMMQFDVIEDHSITLDPRMPAMGNHSSTNNVNPVFDAASKLYKGKVSLTMTGYWTLNFTVSDADDTLIAGNEITEDTPESSVMLEIEF
ncbi:hypothetical protein [Aureivirga sp. CE67]|uniref:hypothetical protein n=1 Tax=Aureivirga sp. CE67 TaxID=1788983 RepID=UPI0018CB7E8A|nr:hypothetical protein [Aureivirga sp. CE67]